MGLVWFELNTKGDTGRESLKMDMGEMGRFCGLPGLRRWSIRPGKEAVWEEEKKRRKFLRMVLNQFNTNFLDSRYLFDKLP